MFVNHLYFDGLFALSRKRKITIESCKEKSDKKKKRKKDWGPLGGSVS